MRDRLSENVVICGNLRETGPPGGGLALLDPLFLKCLMMGLDLVLSFCALSCARPPAMIGVWAWYSLHLLGLGVFTGLRHCKIKEKRINLSNLASGWWRVLW